MIEYKWFPVGVIDSSFRDLRIDVFVNEQGFSREIEFDEYDSRVEHLCVFVDGKPAATGRFIPYGVNAVKIGRIAVKRELRGSGLGEKTVSELIRRARQNGAEKIFVGAQKQAQGFYEKCGFKETGEPEYSEEGVPHINMYKNV